MLRYARVLLVFLLAVSVGCSAVSPTTTPEPTDLPLTATTEPTVQPSATPEPTSTQRPTSTPRPTRTPAPTRTKAPTRTPEPTATVEAAGPEPEGERITLRGGTVSLILPEGWEEAPSEDERFIILVGPMEGDWRPVISIAEQDTDQLLIDAEMDMFVDADLEMKFSLYTAMIQDGYIPISPTTTRCVRIGSRPMMARLAWPGDLRIRVKASRPGGSCTSLVTNTLPFC
jgi:hypothetical protein